MEFIGIIIGIVSIFLALVIYFLQRGKTFTILQRKPFSDRQCIQLWKGEPKDWVLNLDNLATLRRYWDWPDQEAIELALDVIPFEDEKPEGGKIFKQAGVPVAKIGEDINKGVVSVKDFHFMGIDNANKIFKFNRDHKEHMIEVSGRSFRIFLDSVRRLNKGKSKGPNEYCFLISEVEKD